MRFAAGAHPSCKLETLIVSAALIRPSPRQGDALVDSTHPAAVCTCPGWAGHKLTPSESQDGNELCPLPMLLWDGKWSCLPFIPSPGSFAGPSGALPYGAP